MTNVLRTRRGKVKLTKWGNAQVKRNPNALNAVDTGATVNLSGGNITINIPSLDAAWAKMRIVWFGRIDGERASYVHEFTPAEGVTQLGSAEEIQGPLIGIATRYELQVVDADGDIGFGLRDTLVDEAGIPATAPTISDVVVSGSGYTGDVHTVTYSADGDPDPTITFQWKRDGSNIVGATSATYSPDTAGSHTCEVTATNTEGAVSAESAGFAVVAEVAPQLATVSISGSGTINTLHAATYSEAVTAVPAATATYVWELDGTPIGGATASTYTPSSTGSLTVVVTLTNPAGSDNLESSGKTISSTPTNVDPDITGGTIGGGTTAGSTHSIVDLTYIGTPTPLIDYQWKLDGVNAPAPSTSATYVSPVNSSAQLTCTISAINSSGADVYTTPAITLVTVAPPAPLAADWSITTSTPSVGVTEWETVLLKASLGAVEAQWTTTALETDAQAEAAGEFVNMTLSGTSSGNQTWVVGDVISPTGRYFNRFDPATHPSDDPRSGRAAIRFKGASGVWSPRSAVKQISLNTNTRWVDGDWLPFHLRTPEQYWGGALTAPQSEPKPAGGGYQFFRCWANSPADPDFLFATMDVSIPQMSLDFGGWWQSPKLRGMYAGVSGQSCVIDPTDANRILVLHSSGSQRGAAPILNANGTYRNNWDAHSGIYLSTDKGASFTLVKNIPSLTGSASNDADETTVRYMQHVFCDEPGGTPTTRVWWCIAHTAPKDATTTAIYVMKSVNGGTTWTQEGTIPITYGLPTALRRAGNGHWWMSTSNGAYRSTTTPAGTWTNISAQTGGLPNTTMVTDIDVAGAAGEVWALVRGDGLWKTTNSTATTPTWTRIKQLNATAFAISPHNRNHILIAGDNGTETAQRSLNGGSTWDTVQNSKMLGQPEGFQGFIQGTHAYFVWHKTNPDKVFVARFQHHGIINNATTPTVNGCTSTWNSANFDYFWLHDFGWDPDNWQNAVCSVTDRVAIYGVNGFDYVLDDAVNSTVKDTLWNEALAAGVYSTTTSHHMGAGRGALILRNDTNSRVAIFTALGASGAGAARHIMRHSASGTNPIGAVTTGFAMYGGQKCNFGINDPTAKNVGYLGRNRLVLNANNTITQSDMGKECIGIDANGFVYGIDNGGTSTLVYKTSAKPTTALPTWTTWTNLGYQPRPIDSDPRGISWDPNAANGRVFFACENGRFVLAENGVSRVVAVVANLPGSGGAGPPPLFPSVQGYMASLDPNSTAAYISLNRYGSANVYKTNDVTVASPVWYDISSSGYLSPCCGKIFVHPVTSDLIFSYMSGNYIYPAHVKQANSLYDRVKSNINKYQI